MNTQPSVPTDIAQYIIDALDRQDPETLRKIATYAERLAAWKETHAETKSTEDDIVEEAGTNGDDRLDDVPTKASVVVKDINDNQYYYYQWREGDKVKSKYKGPVTTDE